MNQDNRQSNSNRLSSRGEEVKRDLFAGSNNNHLFGRDFSHGYANSQPQHSMTSSSQQLEDIRQKRLFQQNYGQQVNVVRSSQTPHSTYQSTSEFNRQQSQSKDEPFLSRIQQRESRQQYLKTTSSNDDRNDFRSGNMMSSTEQLFYKPQLDQSPQLNIRPQSASRKEFQQHIISRMTPQNLGQSEAFQSFNPTHEREFSGSKNEQHPGSMMSNTNAFDMEQIILNLHSKMKNLENKYIDLANYYKKELISKKEVDPNEYQDAQSRFRSSASSYYTRSRSPYHQQASEIDHNVESHIISELLQEKNDLEKELQNIINLQYKLQEEDQFLQERLAVVENENQDLKQELYRTANGNNQPDTQLRTDTLGQQLEQIEQLKQKVSTLLDKFQGDFLNFINNHYQSFTENDVTGMFGLLKQQIDGLIENVLIRVEKKQFYPQQSQNNLAQDLDEQRREILQQYKKDMESYELNQEYSLQNISRCAFELSNKHSTAKLDMKKLGLTLSSLTKTTQDLSSTIPDSRLSTSQQAFFSIQSDSSQPRSSSGFRRTSEYQKHPQPLQSPTNQSQQQYRLINEIQSQVSILNQTFNEMHNKLQTSEKDMKMLQQVEDDQKNNLNVFKSGIQRFMSEFTARDIASTVTLGQQEPVRFKRIKLGPKKSIDDMVIVDEDQSQIMYNKHIEELKVMNQQLQRELQVQTEKINVVRQENIQLLTELDRQNLQQRASPLRNTYLSIHEQDPSSNRKRPSSIQHRGSKHTSNDISVLQTKLNLLESENETQIRQIRTLNRQLDDKNYEIERIFNQNFTLQQQMQQLKSQENVNVAHDQVVFYQQRSEKSREKLRDVMKKALKFVYTMKKLQKSVHQKQTNVQKEKGDFEVARKELENTLKALKREFENEEQQRQDMQVSQPDSRAGRSVSKEPVRQSTQMQAYQSKAPISRTSRISEKNSTQKRQSASYHQEVGGSSFNVNNRLTISNNSLGNTLMMDERQKRSPIVVRSGQGRPSDMYRSIDAIDRRETTQLTRGSVMSSAEKLQSSPNQLLSSAPNSRLNTIDPSSTTHQVKSLRQEIDMLRKELKEELNDKEVLQRNNQQIQREKDQLALDKNELEVQMERERRRYDAIKREITDLQLEKEALLQQFQKVSTYNPLIQKDIEDVHNRNKRLEDELQMFERMNSEYKRTIQFLEESSEVAKQTIVDLKEALTSKDMEIEDIKGEYAKHSQNKSPTKQSDNEIRKLKAILLEQINQNGQYYEDQLAEMENKIAQKEQDLAQAMRKLDRKLKEKEMNTTSNQADKELQVKVKTLQQLVKDLESKTTANDQLQPLQTKLHQQEQLIHKLKEDHAKALTTLKEQLQASTIQHKEQLSNAKEQLSQAKQQYEEETEKLRQEQQQSQLLAKKQQIDEINGLKVKMEKAQEQRVNEEFNKQKKQHEQEIKELKALFDQDIKALELKLREKVQQTEQNNTQQEQIFSQIKGYEAQIAILTQQHKQKLDQLTQQSKQQQQDLERNFSHQLSEKDNQIQQLQDEIQRNGEEFQKQKTQLETQISQGIKQVNDYKKLLKSQESDVSKTSQQIQLVEKQYQSEIEALQAQLADKDSQLQSLHKDIQSQSKSHIDSKKTLDQQIQSLTTQLTDLKSHYESQLTDVKEQLQHQNQEQSSIITKLQQSLSEKEQQLAQIKGQLEHELQETKKQQEEAEKQLKKYIQEKGKEIEELTKRYQQEKQEMVRQQEVEMSKKQDEVRGVEEKMKEVKKQMEQSIKNKEDVNSQLEQALQEQQNEFEELVQSKEEELQALEQKLKEELKTLKSQLQASITDLTNQRDSKDRELQKQFIQLESLQNDLKEQQSEIQNLHTENNELQIQINQKHQDESSQVQSMSAQINNLHQQISQKEEQINGLKAQLKEKELSYGESEKKLQAKDNELQQVRVKVQENENTLKELQEQLREQIAQYQQLNNQHKDTIQQLKDSKSKLAHQDKQLTDSSNQLKTKDTLILDLQDDIKTLKNQLKDAQSQISHLQGLQTSLLEVQSQKQEIESQTQQVSNELQQKDNEIQGLKKQVQEMENSSKMAKTIGDSLKQELEKLQSEMNDKEIQLSSNEQNLQHELKKKEETVKKKNREIEGLQEQCQDLEEQLSQKDQQVEEQKGLYEQKLLSLQQTIKQYENEYQTLQNNYQSGIQAKDKQIQDVIEEKEKLYEQMQSLVSQNQAEKDTVEEQLKAQISEILSTLKTKEQLIATQQSEIQNLKSTIEQQAKEKDQQIEDITTKAQEELEQLHEELQEAEETRLKHQQTLENNRDLIQMLKTELQKAVDKQKQQEQVTTKPPQDDQLIEENTKLKDQIQKLKSQYEQLQAQFDEIDNENKVKTELIEEANKVIEEFNDEKHEIKAKFKHLVQVYDSVIEESSYKEDDEVDLDECFDKMEQELIKHKQKQEQRTQQLEIDNTNLQEQATAAKEEVLLMQTKMGEIQCELMNAMNNQETNDIQMRKQMETAQRKIQNYKEKLMEKQKYINQLESERKKDSQSNESQVKENAELLMKLQKAEKELQNFRLASSSGRKQQESISDQSMKVDVERIQQLEEQLQSMKKQLFQAKDQVIDNLSETFARRIKELQQIYVNEQILKNKLQEPNMQDLNTQVQECKRISLTTDNALLIIRMQDHYYAINESSISETALTFLRSFIPTDLDKLDLDHKQLQVIAKLEEQIKEIREERTEMQQELALYKQKLLSGSAFGDLQDLKMIELEDDVGHLNVENLEQKDKIKELSLQNKKLKVRILQLNEMLKDITMGKGVEGQENKLLKLIEENEDLKSQIKTSRIDREDIKIHNDEGSFLGGIRGAEFGDNNLFDQSSFNEIHDMITPSNQENYQVKVHRLEQQVDELSRINKNLNNEIQKSREALTPNDQSVIGHIKGTLIQFLKHCPMTEKNNEEFVAIVFSMMEFSKEEIQEVQSYRGRMRANSQSGFTEPDEEGKKKPKKGIMSIFGKKEKELSVKRSATSSSNVMSPSPKPINRY